MKIYVVDNYDSFVYNIVHLLKTLKVTDIKIVKNDQIILEEVYDYDHILLSPGPGIPEEAGRMMEVIDRYHTTHSILGVCLGHQALGQYFGWPLQQLLQPLHGVSSALQIIHHDCLFRQVASGTTVGHYHSWVVEPQADSPLLLTATDIQQHAMAFRHREYRVFGLQFHPESVLTTNGATMLQNWLSI